MKNHIDKIIAKAWMEDKDPREMLKKEGIVLPEDFNLPLKPNLELSEEIIRNVTPRSSNQMYCDYCFCG